MYLWLFLSRNSEKQHCSQPKSRSIASYWQQKRCWSETADAPDGCVFIGDAQLASDSPPVCLKPACFWNAVVDNLNLISPTHQLHILFSRRPGNCRHPSQASRRQPISQTRSFIVHQQTVSREDNGYMTAQPHRKTQVRQTGAIMDINYVRTKTNYSASQSGNRPEVVAAKTLWLCRKCSYGSTHQPARPAAADRQQALPCLSSSARKPDERQHALRRRRGVQRSQWQFVGWDKSPKASLGKAKLKQNFYTGLM